VLRFDLARYRPEVVVPGPEQPKTVAVLRREARAVAAVNGGFFDPKWRPLGLRIAGGETIVKLRQRVDWGVLAVRDGHAEIVHSRQFQADPRAGEVTAAIQVGPRLVVDGQALKLKPQSARRTAVALDRGGRTLALVVTHDDTPAQDLAELLVRLGFYSALLLDGGPSSQLSAALGALRLDIKGAYAVPDALLVLRREKSTNSD
jgi:uncharacterized protein YigE (DUF2233 family)